MNRLCRTLLLFLTITMLIAGCSASKEEQIAEQLSLGQKYLLEQDYEQAVVAFNKVIKLDPQQIEAYEGLMDVYTATGDYASAVTTYSTGLEYVRNQSDENVTSGYLAYQDQLKAILLTAVDSTDDPDVQAQYVTLLTTLYPDNEEYADERVLPQEPQENTAESVASSQESDIAQSGSDDITEDTWVTCSTAYNFNQASTFTHDYHLDIVDCTQPDSSDTQFLKALLHDVYGISMDDLTHGDEICKYAIETTGSSNDANSHRVGWNLWPYAADERQFSTEFVQEFRELLESSLMDNAMTERPTRLDRQRGDSLIGEYTTNDGRVQVSVQLGNYATAEIIFHNPKSDSDVVEYHPDKGVITLDAAVDALNYQLHFY